MSDLNRATVAEVYETVARGELWSSLPVDLQDVVIEIAETTVDAALGETRECAHCSADLEPEEITCERCYTARHAGTCHICNGEIPIAKQRCSACWIEALRKALAARGIAPEIIDVVAKELA